MGEVISASMTRECRRMSAALDTLKSLMVGVDETHVKKAKDKSASLWGNIWKLSENFLRNQMADSRFRIWEKFWSRSPVIASSTVRQWFQLTVLL